MVATTAATSAVKAESRYFYLWMAAAYVVVAFGGFTPTYWSRVATHSFKGPPALHIHGILLSTWVMFYFLQTWFVAQRRILDHRAWGLAGISLFSIMVCSILVAQMAILKMNDARGTGDAARHFSAVALCALPLMAGLFTLAIVYVRKPEVHKRVMIVLMSALMTPAIARVFILLFAPPGAGEGGPPPPFVSLPPALIADLFIVVALVRDWRLQGRPHPVYVYGGIVVVLQQVLTVPFAATSTWMSIAAAFEHLAG